MTATARRLVLLAATALALGCGDDNPSEPRPPSLTGQWAGNNTLTTITLSLTQAGTRVTGNGTLVDESGQATVLVEGEADGFNVTMDIGFPNTNPPLNPITFAGSLSQRDVLSGVLNGSGYNDVAMTLRRQ